MEAGRLGLSQFLLGHANHKLDRRIGVVLLVVADEGRRFLRPLQHRLQHGFLVRLRDGRDGRRPHLVFSIRFTYDWV